MKNEQEIKTALNTIRKEIDTDVVDAIIEDVQNKALRLSQLMGLSAETMASAKKLLHDKEIEVFVKHGLDKMSPSLAAKMLKAYCKDEEAMFEYADRLQSGLVHTLDTLRSVISLHKAELTNSMK